MIIRLNQSFKGLPVGSELSIDSVGGIPVDSFWRKRLKDSVIDNCIEIVKKQYKSKKVNHDSNNKS